MPRHSKLQLAHKTQGKREPRTASPKAIFQSHITRYVAFLMLELFEKVLIQSASAHKNCEAVDVELSIPATFFKDIGPCIHGTLEQAQPTNIQDIRQQKKKKRSQQSSGKSRLYEIIKICPTLFQRCEHPTLRDNSNRYTYLLNRDMCKEFYNEALSLWLKGDEMPIEQSYSKIVERRYFANVEGVGVFGNKLWVDPQEKNSILNTFLLHDLAVKHLDRKTPRLSYRITYSNGNVIDEGSVIEQPSELLELQKLIFIKPSKTQQTLSTINTAEQYSSDGESSKEYLSTTASDTSDNEANTRPRSSRKTLVTSSESRADVSSNVGHSNSTEAMEPAATYSLPRGSIYSYNRSTALFFQPTNNGNSSESCGPSVDNSPQPYMIQHSAETVFGSSSSYTPPSSITTWPFNLSKASSYGYERILLSDSILLEQITHMFSAIETTFQLRFENGCSQYYKGITAATGLYHLNEILKQLIESLRAVRSLLTATPQVGGIAIQPNQDFRWHSYSGREKESQTSLQTSYTVDLSAIQNQATDDAEICKQLIRQINQDIRPRLAAITHNYTSVEIEQKTLNAFKASKASALEVVSSFKMQVEQITAEITGMLTQQNSAQNWLAPFKM
jgi:hypothetical protein